MSDKFTLDVRQAAELAHAFARNGYTNTDIKKMSSGGLLGELLPVIRGTAKVMPIDSDAVVRGNKPAREQAILRPQESMAFPKRMEACDPHLFFHNRNGLYVWDEFRQRILAAARSVGPIPVTQVTPFDLLKNAHDSSIRSELPEGHVFEDTSAFCVLLASMLDRQPKGEEGDLLANDYANIFYVRGTGSEVFVVDAYWDVGDQRWHVFTFRLDVNPWFAGVRVFSRSC